MLAWHEVLKTFGNIRILSLLLLVLTSFSSSLTKCRAQADSLFIEIDSTLFITDRHTSSVKAISGKITEVSLEQIQDLPNILGNTDPVRFIRSLPGVQTNSEYDSGIHIQGCDNAHNEISIAGVPIYGVSHLFGLFSIFNPSHFDRMRFSTSSEENRLGGASRHAVPTDYRRHKHRIDILARQHGNQRREKVSFQDICQTVIHESSLQTMDEDRTKSYRIWIRRL